MSELDSAFRASSRYKIILGVDYGTTYSGVSFVTTNKSGLDDINVITTWPDHRFTEWKTPTRIAYAEENQQKIDQTQWGFQVAPGLKSYSWMKLLLEKKVDLTRFDDPQLKNLYGGHILTLPKNKSAQDLCEDFLRELYKYTVQKLEKELDAEVFRRTPMEVWLTVPAIWTDEAQAATRDAALAAGFGSRAHDILRTIKEPEAAALAAMKPHLGRTALDPIQGGEVIMVCDCGGGTVDIVSYLIKETDPVIKFDEVCMGMGAKCGSTAIDRNFNKWMIEKFGDDYESLPMTKRGPGSKFMTSFESAKRNFRGSSNDKTAEVGPIILDVVSPLYDDDEMAVKISKRDMESLFQPVVKDLLGLVDAQAALAKRKTGRNVDRFVLVGGFGDSDYLNEKLKRWCTTKGVKRFTCPTHCQAAIVKGAALRGLEGLKPSITIATRHYGWSWGEPFREGIDDEKNSYVGKYDGVKMCRGKMHWAINMHQELKESIVISRAVVSPRSSTEGDSLISTMSLYECTLNDPPERVENPRVVKIAELVTSFDEVPIWKVDSKYNSTLNQTIYRFEHTVEIQFRAEQGTLQFKSTAYGSEQGKTSVKFNRDR